MNDLDESIASLAASLAAAWARIERLERSAHPRPVIATPTPDLAPRGERCSTTRAAKYLGCSRRHVDALIASGALEAWDTRRPGAKRARHAVAVSSLRAFLATRHEKIKTAQKEVAPTQRTAALRR